MFSENGLSFRRCIIAVGRTDMRLGIDGLGAADVTEEKVLSFVGVNA